MSDHADQNNSSRRPNRLIREKSPYLLQHAHNPVDWFPWGEEAFEKARAENKPVFLSIGYSTCHWCHVMERESFADPAAAEVLNRSFVCIKVDREERPDLDQAYMAAAQLLGSPGGWPLTIIMTPEQKPFFAAAYLPKNSGRGRLGLLDLAPRILEVWSRQKEKILSLADQVTLELQKVPRETTAGPLDSGRLAAGFQQLSAMYDQRRGGFGSAPKFPTPHHLLFLLRHFHRTRDPQALAMVNHTLSAMRQGGICDQLGGGFHRYSTDANWLVPHFEKMLYDQALLALAYTEAHQAAGRADHEQTVREILGYVLRDLAAPEGAFYSAEDADSEGVEGKFYLWTLEEVRSALTREEAELAEKVFNLRAAGNFREPGGEEAGGQNILHLPKPLAELGSELGLSSEALATRLSPIRAKLFAAREKRARPPRDDQVLTDWNGLMIAALARASQVFDDAADLVAAEKAADFFLAKMRDGEGRLDHRFREGEAGIPGFLEDYAFLIWALLELYEAGFKVKYLRAALELSRYLLAHFADPKSGGFFQTSDEARDDLFRSREAYDGARPSGNSVAMLDLIRLGRITADPALEDAARSVARAFLKMVSRQPAGFTFLLSAIDFALGPAAEIVIAGDPEDSATRALLRALRKNFLPNKVVILRPPGETPEIAELCPYLREMKTPAAGALAYVCRNFQCASPTADPEELLNRLGLGHGVGV